MTFLFHNYYVIIKKPFIIPFNDFRYYYLIYENRAIFFSYFPSS